MNTDELLAVALALPGAWPDTPFGDAVVAKVGRRIFAFPSPDAVSLKGRPADLDELRAVYPRAVTTAPYLAKRHWVRVTLDGTVPDDELEELLRASYALVVAGLPRAQRPG